MMLSNMYSILMINNNNNLIIKLSIIKPIKIHKFEVNVFLWNINLMNMKYVIISSSGLSFMLPYND